MPNDVARATRIIADLDINGWIWRHGNDGLYRQSALNTRLSRLLSLADLFLPYTMW